MANPSREFLKVLTTELEAHGLKYDVENTTRHKKLHIHFPSGRQFIVIPSSPSDHRGVTNSLALLRRWIRCGVPARPWVAAKAA